MPPELAAVAYKGASRRKRSKVRAAGAEYALHAPACEAQDLRSNEVVRDLRVEDLPRRAEDARRPSHGVRDQLVSGDKLGPAQPHSDDSV